MFDKIEKPASFIFKSKDSRNIVRKQLRIIFYERILTKRRIKYIHSGTKPLNEIPLNEILGTQTTQFSQFTSWNEFKSDNII